MNQVYFLELREVTKRHITIYIFDNVFNKFTRTSLHLKYLSNFHTAICILTKDHFTTNLEKLQWYQNQTREALKNLQNVDLFENTDYFCNIISQKRIVNCPFCPEKDLICGYCCNSGLLDLLEWDKEIVPELRDYFLFRNNEEK